METLHPIDNGIWNAKLIEVLLSNIFWYLVLAEIFDSHISAGAYHGQGQHVATSVLWGADQFAS